MPTQYVNNLLGKGPKFPFTTSTSNGVSYNESIERINQSLFLIFETPKGRRLMMPEFGSDIHKYRFDPLDAVLMEKLRYTITEDVKKWEPRIRLTSVEFLSDTNDIDNSILYVSITYKLINTPVTANYVYPYRRETYDTETISYRKV